MIIIKRFNNLLYVKDTSISNTLKSGERNEKKKNLQRWPTTKMATIKSF